MALTSSLNPNAVAGTLVANEVVNRPDRRIQNVEGGNTFIRRDYSITQVHEWYALTSACAVTASFTADSPPALSGLDCVTTFDVYLDSRVVDSYTLRRTRYYYPEEEEA